MNWPEAPGLRIDHWIESGIEVSSLFDPMLAKIISYDVDRQRALATLAAGLADSELYGIETNLDYLQALLAEPVCQRGELLTRSLAGFSYQPTLIQVLQGGTQTTIQDYPGRSGLWHVGVPPSGPMDSLSFRLANRLLNNPIDAAALEITLNGPTLLFTVATQIAICGGEIEASIDGDKVAMPKMQKGLQCKVTPLRESRNKYSQQFWGTRVEAKRKSWIFTGRENAKRAYSVSAQA